MSRPRFLADHDLNEHIVHGVLRREPAIEFVRVRDVGLHEHSDAEVLEYAAIHQLIVVSHDVNTMTAEAYARIREAAPAAGLLLVKQSDPVGRVIDDLILIWSTSEAEEWQNAVSFLPLCSLAYCASIWSSRMRPRRSATAGGKTERVAPVSISASVSYRCTWLASSWPSRASTASR